MSLSLLLFNVLLFLAGFTFLTGGAELMVRGASRLAARMNVSSVVIGLTIVAFGTSLPEFVVSLVANLSGDGAIAIGNIVGSNIANIGLILTLAALLTTLPVHRHLVRREFPMMLLVSVFFVAVAWNGSLDRFEGAILVGGIIVFTYYSYTSNRQAAQVEAMESLDVAEAIDPAIGRPSARPWLDAGLVVLGLGGLVLGADWLVESATNLARAIGVSELVIGLTLVAVGTSLPELATTVVAVRRNEADLAVGNVVGSNIFNILFIGGINALIRPLPIPPALLVVDFPVMLGIALLAFALVLPFPHQVTRAKGSFLLILYLGYIAWLFLNTNAAAAPLH